MNLVIASLQHPFSIICILQSLSDRAIIMLFIWINPKLIHIVQSLHYKRESILSIFYDRKQLHFFEKSSIPLVHRVSHLTDETRFLKYLD